MPRLNSSKKTYGFAAFFTVFAILFIAPFLLGGNRAPYEAGFALISWLGLGFLLLHCQSKKHQSISIPFIKPIGLTLILGAIALIPWPEAVFADVYPTQHNLLSYLKALLPPPLN